MFQIGDKVVDHFAGDVLHYHYVRQISSEAVVETVGEVVLGYDLIAWTAEKHCIAVCVVPAWPTDTSELGHQVFRIFHYAACLRCPAVDADGLCQPPEFQRVGA